MSSTVRVACVQMNSGPVMEDNFRTAEGFIREAAGRGARFIATPENTDLMCYPPSERLKGAYEQDAHPGVAHFSALAKDLRVWLLIGSMAVKAPGKKLCNRSFLFSNTGDLAAVYDKIHMFDVQLPGGETHKESDLMKPGEKAVVAKTPFAQIGMSVCYDLRFAYLYRDLAKVGAEILMIPAAFTVPTGQAHWKTLLRARAIETGSFVMAPAQTGEHAGGRRTWGHSMIVSPWGEILAQMDNKTGMITADIHLEEVAKARGAIPALKHDRTYKVE